MSYPPALSLSSLIVRMSLGCLQSDSPGSPQARSRLGSHYKSDLVQNALSLQAHPVKNPGYNLETLWHLHICIYGVHIHIYKREGTDDLLRRALIAIPRAQACQA